MTSSVLIKPYAIDGSTLHRQDPYDILIATWGYELRSSFIPSEIGPNAIRRFATSFPEQHTLSFAANGRRLRGKGFRLIDGEATNYRSWLRSLLVPTVDSVTVDPISVAYDISSVSRERLALFMEVVLEAGATRCLSVDFLYAPAVYTRPKADEAAILDAGPVTNLFAGWVPELDRPPVGIVGVGYERDRALGSLEYLDVAEAWAFVPEGEDIRYDRAVARMNETLWGAVPSDHIRKYRVDDPYATLVEVMSVLDGTVGNSRPIVLPFGPKVFSLVALVAAVLYRPRAAVWRVSSGARAKAHQQRATGKIVGLRLSVSSGSEGAQGRSISPITRDTSARG